VVGPRHLKGDSTRYYFLVLRDVFDLADSRKMAGIMAFLVHAWQHIGLPQMVQFDNGREFCGFGRGARNLSRVIRLSRHLGIEPVFIPEGEAQRNGSVEQFNGWFQPVLLNRPYRRPADLRRQLGRLMTSVNEEHVHPKLGHRTSAQFRRTRQLRKLPADFEIDGQRLSISVGKGSFIRLVGAQGTINILGQQYKVGKRLKFHYVKATLYTARQTLKVYHRGHLTKVFPYKLAVR